MSDWKTCRIGSCQRHRECMYRPCRNSQPSQPNLPESQDPVPTIHVLAQTMWHDPAWIIGNRSGLELLRAALNAALDGDEALGGDGCGVAHVFARDGEGFPLVVMCREDEMSGAPYGYTDEIALGKGPERWPEWMVKVCHGL